jgi:hypothetical protein
LREDWAECGSYANWLDPSVSARIVADTIAAIVVLP